MEEIKGGKVVTNGKLADLVEFEDHIKNSLNLCNFSGVSKFKSIARAYRKGYISRWGDVYPKRPFNNRGNTSKRKGKHSRVFNEKKKAIYAQFKGYNKV